MKTTKIYAGERYLGRFTCDGRTYSRIGYQLYLAKEMTKKCMLGALVMVLGGWLFTAGVIMAHGTIEPERVWAKEVIEVPIKEVPPVMKRIAKCESGGQHYKNGQVVINPTQDAGLYQINLPVWSKTATQMGLNLMVEADNEAFAMYLYENYGTEPWYSSAKCWR